jgi:CBS domain containing-hemolysin-like protein
MSNSFEPLSVLLIALNSLVSNNWSLSSLPLLGIELAEALLRLTMLVALVVAIGFFVAAELSLVAASPQHIHQLSQDADPGKAKAAQRVKHAQSHLQQYLSVTQTGTTAGSLLLGWLGEGATVHWIEPWMHRLPLSWFPAMLTTHSIAVVVAFLLVTYVEILLGELVPKVLAAHAPERTALLLIQPLQLCSYLFFPLLVLLNSNVRCLTGWLTQADVPALAPACVLQTDRYSALVFGGAELAIVNQELGLSLPLHPAYQTIAGFMIHQLGRRPEQGEHLVWGELELEAASVVAEQIKTVRLRQVTCPLLQQAAEAMIVNN